MKAPKTINKEMAEIFNEVTSKGIRIYPQVPQVKWSKKPPRAHLVLDIGGKKKVSEETYDQGQEMTDAIIKLYTKIYNKLKL